MPRSLRTACRGAAEGVQHYVAGVGVVGDVADDGFVRHLGVVAVGAVERARLALAHVAREGRAAVAVGAALVRRAGVLHERGSEGVGVGRVREAEDGRVVGVGEALLCAEVRVSEALREALQEDSRRAASEGNV